MIAESIVKPAVVKHDEDIPVGEIFSDPNWNARGTIKKSDVQTLAADIAATTLLQRIVVAPVTEPHQYKYKVLAGHRRYEAVAKILKWETIPATVIEGLTPLQERSINLKENIQRKDLNILQEAQGLKDYKKFGWTQQQIARELEQSQQWVRVRFALLDLEPDIQQVAAAGLLTQQQIVEIKDMPSNERYKTVRMIRESKARGDRSSLQIVKKNPRRDPFKRKRREPADIQDMMERIYDALGPCLATRFGAWAAGNISDLELFRDLKREHDALPESEKRGKRVRLPDGVRDDDLNREY